MKVSAVNGYTYSNNIKAKKSQIMANEPSFEGLIKTRRAGVKLSCLPSLGLFAQFIPKIFIDFPPLQNLALTVAGVGMAALGLDILNNAVKITEKPLQLAENIEFKKAETTKEATEFAKKNFKIKKFKVEDLELANWINEGLCNVNNRFKGKVYMPSKIVAKELKEGVQGSYSTLKDTLYITTRGKEKADELLDFYLEDIDEILLKHPLGTQHDNLIKIVDKAKKDPNSLSKVEKWMLEITIAINYEALKEASEVNPVLLMMAQLGKVPEQDLLGPTNYNKFHTLYHEMGHVFQTKSTPLLSRFVQLFNSIKAQLPLHPYTKSKYSEFVSDMFAGIMNNDKYPQNYMNLFHNVTNIRFPDIETDIPLNTAD